MFKKLFILLFLFSCINLNAKNFSMDESNSLNKFSLLEIEPIDDYFRFNVHVMQRNQWKFKSDVFITSDNLNKKIMADFYNNIIVFSLNEKEFMKVMESEFLTIKSHLNYSDTFYIPNFRDIPAYDSLRIEEFKNKFIEE